MLDCNQEVIILVNVKAMQEIHKLSSLYEKRWGKEVDYVGMPTRLCQETLLQVLRLIVDTGDSILVGFQKRKALVDPYHDYLENFHENNDIQNGFVFEKPCPLCNKKVIYYEQGNSYEYRCETENCFNSTFRGI